MKKLMICGLACLAMALALPDSGCAHGGQWRGPGDVVPPNAGGGGRAPGARGPNTHGPSSPSGPRPNSPATPGPSSPTSGSSTVVFGPPPTTGGRGAQLTPDLNRWQFWWEFNKDPFINLKEAIHATGIVTGSDDFFMGHSKHPDSVDNMKPVDSEIVGRILPALKRTLDATDQHDIVSSCLVAMAKVGKNHDSFRILDVMRPYLAYRNQEIRETAAVAMGISQMPAAIEDLVELVRDTAKGHKLVNDSKVDDRTRSFACYGLGLVAQATSSVDNKRRCFEALNQVLQDTTKNLVNRNIPTAAINSIRLITPNRDGGDKARLLLGDCLATLWTYYEKKAGPTEQQVQAHVPPAISQLLGRGGDTTGKYKQSFADLLAGKLGKHNNSMYQSAAIALGTLCLPQEIDRGDKRYSDALWNYYQTGKDEQTRYFSLMALAKIGGDSNRNSLLKAFSRSSKALVKPWAAISLGVLAFNAAESGAGDNSIGYSIGAVLHRGLGEIKNSQTQSAIAVALGLCKYKDAADDLEARLIRNKQRDELAGYLCIGLALMDSKKSITTIQHVAATSIRRPELLSQAAIALGKMGDKKVTESLQRMLQDENRNVARLSAVSSALGFIGDRRTIRPLIATLYDETITPLSRAFAAVALGGVADKEPLRWNSKIAVDMNYRAAVETLTNSSTGVLNIL